ncbi:DNA polymerase delta subunit 2 isoform X2 [Ptiloglossa arizonensis]|uniref:DNA polymerase delta subunit 2 isoform X2 n=1 Tax=Ptiloglossa arizonensis TaxID=3350558 RepID=UPI003FA020B8
MSSGMEIYSPLVYNRKSLKFQDFAKFKVHSKSFEKQYCDIYSVRLTTLKDCLLERAKVKWAQYEVITLSELAEKDQDNNCILIGTLYKHQELKPSILRELSEKLQVTPQPPQTNYASFKDALFLEDEMLRIKLVGNHMNIQDVVTGIVCAVFGRELEDGYCPKLTTFDKPLKQWGQILIISGLDLANNTQPLSLNLLSEWIIGMIGCIEIQKTIASIVCIIIAGNSVKGSVETHNYERYFETKANYETLLKYTAMTTHKLDDFLHSIVQCCPIILMPGEFDPTCHMLPQQSFHPCILPQCFRFKSFHGVTNPWIGSINSRTIAGSSGQPIMNIMMVAGLADVSPLVWLERTLEWRHYVPTAPDTVPGYPYSEVDPFIMTECPDIYFVGNMDKYDTKLVTANEGQAVRLICIPKFSKSQTGVLVDLQDLETRPISFTIS